MPDSCDARRLAGPAAPAFGTRGDRPRRPLSPGRRQVNGQESAMPCPDDIFRTEDGIETTSAGTGSTHREQRH